MPPSPQSEPSAHKLRVAIRDLDGIFDRFDDHQLRSATMECRGQFAEAVGDHPQGVAVLAAIGRGEASEALGLARKLLQELEDSSANAPTTTTTQVGAAASK